MDCNLGVMRGMRLCTVPYVNHGEYIDSSIEDSVLDLAECYVSDDQYLYRENLGSRSRDLGYSNNNQDLLMLTCKTLSDTFHLMGCSVLLTEVPRYLST